MPLTYLKTHDVLHSLDLRIDKYHVLLTKNWLIHKSLCLKPDLFEDIKSFSMKNDYFITYIRLRIFFQKLEEVK